MKDKWEQLPFKVKLKDSLVSGIVCNLCLNLLPPHTGAEHLDPDHPIHICPHEVINFMEDDEQDMVMYVACEECGEVATLGHQYWCASTCQHCKAMIQNPLHDCEGKDECYYGE